MSRAPRRAPPQATSARERLTAVEVRLEDTLVGIKDELRALSEAVKGLASVADLKAIGDRVTALERAAFTASGAAHVQSQARTNLQEWARVLAPILITWAMALAGALVGLRAFQQ